MNKCQVNPDTGAYDPNSHFGHLSSTMESVSRKPSASAYPYSASNGTR